MGHQLETPLLFVGETYVVVVHVRNAVTEYLLGRDIQSERVYGDDYQLEKRIPTVYVERRVALGEPEILRQLQRVGVRHPLVEDLRKDEVRRAVQDTLHRHQQIVVVILLQIAYDGDRSARRRVVQQRHVVARLKLDQLLNVVRQHLLVTRHHGQTRLQGALDDGVCRIGIVDQLNDEVYVGIAEDIVGPIGKLRVDGARLAQIAHAYTFDLDILRSHALQHLVKAFAYRAETEKSDIQFFSVHDMYCSVLFFITTLLRNVGSSPPPPRGGLQRAVRSIASSAVGERSYFIKSLIISFSFSCSTRKPSCPKSESIT